MCDAAWTMVAEHVRATANADRSAYLMAGEEPPSPDARLEELRAVLNAPPESESMTLEMRRLRRLLGV
jgi:tagatose-1,6-bisphosphate aldolase non-catalytic subunit AgaZ/GatZ